MYLTVSSWNNNLHDILPGSQPIQTQAMQHWQIFLFSEPENANTQYVCSSPKWLPLYNYLSKLNIGVPEVQLIHKKYMKVITAS